MLRHFGAIALYLVLALGVSVLPAQAAEYHLSIGEMNFTAGGTVHKAIAVNGQIPGPTLHFTEGESVTIHVTNTLATETSIHWHGFLLPAAMDGVPGFSGYPGIKPGATFTYRFTIKQNGTYWYHAHSGLQEQAGIYGPIVIAPKGHDPVVSDRDYVVMLSDFPGERPARILANLKASSDYYNYAQRTVGDFFHDIATKGLGATLKDRAQWGDMRMSPTDLSDVSHYTFLINGKDADENPGFLFKPGNRVRLRLINGAAMTYFDVKLPGLKMIVVAADGQDVTPVPVDELRIAPAETYDVIVIPKTETAYTIFAQAMDRTGYARATLAPRAGMSAPVPKMYPRALLSMADMPGMKMDGMKMPGMKMDHSKMDDTAMDHAAMGHMGHDMGAMAMEPATAKPVTAKPAAKPDTQPVGWDAGYPSGEKVLSYADLRSLEPNADQRKPGREIIVHLGGNMERYIWTLNGKKFADAKPIELRYGERVKLTFVNDTMMAHPMHLHGMFVELLNGQPAPWLPRKHIVNVKPGQSYSVLLSANAPGEWAFHCHLLYHMASGMMRKVVVARMTADAMP